MSLEKKIQEQYNKRVGKDNLYTSVYSQLADIERISKTKHLLDMFFKAYDDKTMLEVGAGHGDNIHMFMDFGFKKENIFLNELLPERIQVIKHKFQNIKLYEGDVLKINFNETFDCIYQSTVFSSILNNEDRKNIAKKMWELLNPNGIILWYDFIYNNPRNSDVKKVSIKELKSLFPVSVKSQIYKVTLAPPVGRCVGKLYTVFNVPILRSHVLAVFQKQK